VVGKAVGLGDGNDVGITGYCVGLGVGINESLVGIEVVGNFVGVVVGLTDGIGLGEGLGITEGLDVGKGAVGNKEGGCDGEVVGKQVWQINVNQIWIWHSKEKLL
jgi:hypothetical protein